MILTPEDYDDLFLEQTEGINPLFIVKKKDTTALVNNQTTKTSKPVVCPDVHETSMEIVETVLWGGAVE